MSDTIKIFSEDSTEIYKRIVSSFETATGRQLAPGDIESLLINSFAYELQLLRIQANMAIGQNLVRFATGSMLEYLAELVAVRRLPAQGSQTTIRFDIIDGHGGILIPAGLRIQSTDGKVVFVTPADITVKPGTLSIDILCTCQTLGTIGNNYAIGKVSMILDPKPFIRSATNISVSNSGIDQETDEQLRERIYLAPASFSVAGPSNAYAYWAKSAHQSIVDVSVITTEPGTVTIYPLCEGGTMPSDEILNSVLSICDDKKIRPQNDTVKVDSPGVIEYDITASLTIYDDAIAEEVLTTVTQQIQGMLNKRNNRMGLDVMRTQIISLCMVVDKVYNVNLISPSFDIVADEKTFVKCSNIDIKISGSNHG